ncbi:non-homologous end-joining factor 1 isoform 1-T5 [Aulostomus maculatus]
MMEASEATADFLLQCPWIPVNIDGFHLLAKSWFGETAYHILLTDMQCVWEERMDSAAIQSRAQELNRRLRAQVEAFFSHLCEVVQPCLSGGGAQLAGEAQMSARRLEGGDISLRLKSKLAGLPFHWEFHCTAAPVTLVCVQLVRPLLAMSRLLQQQTELLGGLLVRKDAEIQDYKENGATLSRERLQTEVFEEQSFREGLVTKTLPLVCSEHQDTLDFSSSLQNLYAAVVSYRTTRKRKLSGQNQPATADPDLTPSLDGEAGETSEQSRTGQAEAPAAKMADTPATQQSLPVTSDPAVRPPSKPKKKKVLGLFR